MYRCMHLGKWIFTTKKTLIAGQIFSIWPSDSINLRDKFWQFYGQFAKSNSTTLLSTNKVYEIRTSSMILKIDLNVRYQTSDWPAVNHYNSKPLSHVWQQYIKNWAMMPLTTKDLEKMWTTISCCYNSTFSD